MSGSHVFEWNAEQRMIRKMLRKWATEVLEPEVPALEAGASPYPLMKKFAATCGIKEMVRSQLKSTDSGGREGASKRLGLAGGDAAISSLVSLELSRVCPGFALAFGASIGLAGGAIMARGTAAQRERYGLPLLTVERIGAWGMTEPGAGSDAFRSMRTVAVPKDGGYLLSGQKTFITNAPDADFLLIYAKIDNGDGTELAGRPIEAFVIERDDKGLTTGAPMKKMGMHSSPTGEIFLGECFVPNDRLLGGEPKSGGRRSGRDVFHAERTGMAPMCVGIIQRALEISLSYATERQTWGRPIAGYQLVQEKLARMYMHLQNCEALMFKQLALGAAGASMNAAEASATKLYCARASTECALEAVQILGGNGYMQEYRVEMLARDAKLLQIGGGTDEIQILNVARTILADSQLLAV